MSALQKQPEKPEVDEDDDHSYALEVAVTQETYEALRKKFQGVGPSEAVLKILRQI